VPADGFGQEGGFFREFLSVILAEVEVFVFRIVEGEDIVGGFEFGDGDEADLKACCSQYKSGTCVRSGRAIPFDHHSRSALVE
jgi:hypothetical protein